MTRLTCAVMAAAVCMALIALPLAAAGPRLIAVGDIHGEYDGFVSILRQAGVIDEKLRWTGGATTLVQTGDFLDRGVEVRKVMDLLMNLERAAPRRRGRVTVLLGNHEVMNMAGIFQDLHPGTFNTFADRHSERRRQNAYKQYVALHEKLAQRYSAWPLKTQSEAEWMASHPPGFIEFQDALDRDGRYGRWLRTKPVVAKIGDSIFLHGGISPAGPEQALEKINEQARLEIEGIDRIREYLIAQGLILPFFTYEEVEAVVQRESQRPESEQSQDMKRVLAAFRSLMNWSVFDPAGPLWYRGFGQWSEEEGERQVAPLLARFGARRFVVGHTIPPDASQILPRFGGKVFLIDTGMLRGYAKNGRPAALEINGQSVSAIYEAGRVPLNVSERLGRVQESAYRLARLVIRPIASTQYQFSFLGPDNTRLPFRTSAEVADFLRRSKVVKVDKKKLHGVTKPLRVTVESNGVRARGVFRSHHREQENAFWEGGMFTEFLRDSYKSEIAAYELSLLLGLDMIPPTVAWQMNRRPHAVGALQLWIEKARPGFHPQEVEKPLDPERWEKEREKMRIFDALIRNVDRHESNMLVDSTGKVWWIDHSRSFGREQTLYEPEKIQRVERTIWQAIRDADPAAIARVLAPYMSEREVQGLLKRRELLLALIDQRIAEKGEQAVVFTIDVIKPLFAPAASSRASGTQPEPIPAYSVYSAYGSGRSGLGDRGDVRLHLLRARIAP